MRQVILDTETTGFNATKGDRIIEIGCIEIIDRKFTGRTFHQYIQPEREVPEDAIKVHGITNEFLVGKPLFADIAEDFFTFVDGSEMIAHNAPFDVGFIDAEFATYAAKGHANHGLMKDYCKVTDSLDLAKQMHPGQKNNLNALCKRYFIDTSHREFHGALLDAQMLADVWLLMTGGQTDLSLEVEGGSSAKGTMDYKMSEGLVLPVLKANNAELAEHETFMKVVEKAAGDNGVVWSKL